MDKEHFWATLVYVEQNSLRAGLSDDWRWSSSGARLAGAGSGLLDLVRWREQHTLESWKRCLELGLRDSALFERIREATLYGKPVGRRRSSTALNSSLRSRPARVAPAARVGKESHPF